MEGAAPGPASGLPPLPDDDAAPSLRARLAAWSRRFGARHPRLLPAAGSVLVVLALLGGWRLLHPMPRQFTQWDIDNAVRYTLSHTDPPPADTAIAAATVGPSVVRVEGYLASGHAAQAAKGERDAKNSRGIRPLVPHTPDNGDGKDDKPDATGSGVVIDAKGDILTNLHVIRTTDRWVITFWDGSKSEAQLVNIQPENDLAVIRARTAPDDLKPATLASTAGLNPGDTVVAVGFPFGIGPSVSAGVVAGLKREFADPDQKKEGGKGGRNKDAVGGEESGHLTNLIQFDAAVNPGNSGGPLVNRDGEVVGIVTALFNPTGQHVFAGMAFAVPIENAAKAVGDNPL